MNTSPKLALLLLLIILTAGCDQSNKSVSGSSQDIKIKRYGSVIKVRPEKLDLYKALHADPWPGVLKQITKSNIRNYSIYLKDNYLFSYFEYVGDDFEADMRKMAQDSITQAWWELTDPCQEPLDSRAEGEWWASMEEVFHHD